MREGMGMRRSYLGRAERARDDHFIDSNEYGIEACSY